MANVMDTLRARGFVKQTVYEEELYENLTFVLGASDLLTAERAKTLVF